MTRSSLRFPWAEIAAILGIFFGVWLIHNIFQPAGDLPNYVLLGIGALDILMCFALLGYLLRARLRAGEPLPRSWIAAGTVLIACFLGWIGALFLDSDRLLRDQEQHNEALKQIAVVETSLHHMSAVLPAENFAVDAAVWKTNHDDYARVNDQLRGALRGNSTWDKELKGIDDDVQQMNKLFTLLVAPNPIEVRLKWRAEFALAREHAATQAEALRKEIAKAEADLAVTHRARWHAVGASALTSVVLLFGCLLFWLLFDRELRRSWKAQSRLADDEARFRSLIENQSEPIAVIDPAGNILYVNPIWKSAFGYQLEDLTDSNLLELIHPEDRQRVRTAFQTNDGNRAIPCRLAADYGIWHDVELQYQPHADADAPAVVRVRDVRETSDVPMHPQPELLTDEKLTAALTHIADLEKENADLRERESKARSDAEHHQWLLGSHQQANSEGVLVLSARGDVISWNPSFVRLWKLSDDTMNGHTWQTIAAHMESQVASGWDDFQKAVQRKGRNAETTWEMALEGDRTLTVHAQTLNDHPSGDGAVRFQFRDVTQHKSIESQLRDHQDQASDWQKRLGEHAEQIKAYEGSVRDHEKRAKQMDKQLRERDQQRADLETQLRDRDHQRAEMEATLRDHQDRLHQMHEAHESHEATLKASREASRRLASGAANDINNVLSVVLGNTDVLRDTLPKDHVAQNYLDDIHHAASKGTELSQRLMAFGRQHLMQMAPVEMNEQLASLEGKIRVALGHVQLLWERSDKELWAKTDAHPLEQALLHLVTHARQHMPDGGTLTIHTDRVELSRNELTHADMQPGSYVQLRLKDTGAGIADDKLTHVFEPYHPIIEGQKGDLSLATAYGILRQSGGCIDVTSEKGKGTEWTILLPETTERPQQTATPARASA